MKNPLPGFCAFPSVVGLVGLLVLAAPAADSAPAPDAPAPVHLPAQEVGPYLVGLDFLTPRVEVGQPLQLRLHYKLARPVLESRFQITWDLSHDLMVTVVYPGNREIRLRSVKDALLPVSSIFQVDIGETQWLEKSLLYVPEAFTGLIFEETGVYTVRIRVRCGLQGRQLSVIEFPPVRVQVTPPGPGATKAIEFLTHLPVEQSRAIVADLQAGRASDANAPVIDQLLRAAPSSPLAPYALYALARHALQAKELQKARQWAVVLYQQFPDHLLADQAVFVVYQVESELGNTERARDTLLYLYLAFPDTDLLRSHDPMYEEVVLPALHPAANEGWMLFEPAKAPTQEEWIALTSAQAVPSGEVPSPRAAGPPPQEQPNVLLEEALSSPYR